MDKFRKLYNVASTQVATHAAMSCFYNQMKTGHLGQGIYKLALDVQGVQSLSDAEILPVFFTAEAIEELLRLPNIYWFWQVVKDSAVIHDDLVTSISLVEVKRAMSEMRSNAARSTDLRKDLATLSQVETAFWVANGILLCKVGDKWEKSVVRNPIYEYND
jgi:hypothetical protein